MGYIGDHIEDASICVCPVTLGMILESMHDTIRTDFEFISGDGNLVIVVTAGGTYTGRVTIPMCNVSLVVPGRWTGISRVTVVAMLRQMMLGFSHGIRSELWIHQHECGLRFEAIIGNDDGIGNSVYADLDGTVIKTGDIDE